MNGSIGFDQTRTEVVHGLDCVVTFLGQADNSKALVEVWQIVMSGQKFKLRLMRMRHKKPSDPFVFGSIWSDSYRQDIWTFRDDARVVDHDFRGDVFTILGDDGMTYVSYQTAGMERFKVLLSDLLLVEQPVVAPLVYVSKSTVSIDIMRRKPRFAPAGGPVDRSQEMLNFVENVLVFM